MKRCLRWALTPACVFAARAGADPVRVVVDMDWATPGIQSSITVEAGTTVIPGVAIYIYDPDGTHSIWGIGYLGGLDRGISFGHMRPEVPTPGTVTGITGHIGTPVVPGASHYVTTAIQKAFDGPELQYLAYSSAAGPLPTSPVNPIFTVDIHLAGAREGATYLFFIADMVSIWHPGGGAFCTIANASLDTGGDCVPDGTRTSYGIDADTAAPVPPAAFQVDYIDGPAAIHVTGCFVNCDHSTAPPILNANDFQCFLNKYAAGDAYANCDGSTAPPVLNANDFQCFLNAFATGAHMNRRVSKSRLRVLLGIAGASTGPIAAAQDCLWSGGTTPSGPSQRTGFSVAFDTARHRAVLFGGYAYNIPPFGTLGDTWEWDGASWALRATTGPIARFGSLMAYDAARGKTVLYGGHTSEVPYDRDDTWEWDGQTWTQAAAVGPGATGAYKTIFYDAHIQKVSILRFPYQTGPSLFWEWNGSAWTIGGGFGLPDGGGISIYDEARSKVIVYFTSTTIVAPIWEYQAGTWTPRGADGAPSVKPRLLTLDSSRGKLLFYGGTGGGFPSYYDLGRETWEWDTTTGVWSLVSNARPQGLEEFQGYYDAARARSVMIAAHYPNILPNEVWEYNATAANPGLIFTQQPETMSLTPGQTGIFHVAATGAGPITIQWRRNGQPLQDGGNISGVHTGTLTIGPVTRADEGIIDAIVTDACGPVVSLRGTLGVYVPCYANCDQSTGAPMLNANDFQCFLNVYAAGCSGDPLSCYVNCDQSTSTPVLTANDFQCFLNSYAAGCP